MSGTSRGPLRAWAAATLLVIGVAILPVTHARAAGSVVQIRVINYKYSDSDLVIDPGTTVEWKVDQGDHTATSYGAEFDSQDIGPFSDPYRHTFNRPGRYDYRCQFHVARFGMSGVIEVRDPAGAPTTTEPSTTSSTLPPYTTTTTGPPTTTTTRTPATTPTTSATNTTTASTDPPGNTEPPTTAVPISSDPSATTAPPRGKGSSSTTAPAARGRGGSAVPGPAPAPATNPPAGTTATPPTSAPSSTTSASTAAAPDPAAVGPAPEVTVPQEDQREAAAPAGEGQKGDRGDLHRVFALTGLAAVGGGGYGLRRWLPRRR